MICQTCADRGIVTLNWSDAQHEYAVCLCTQGREMRATQNYRKTVAPLWQVWAAREQVDPALVWLLEEVLTAPELAERGFQVGVTESSVKSREAALLAAGRGKQGAKL